MSRARKGHGGNGARRGRGKRRAGGIPAPSPGAPARHPAAEGLEDLLTEAQRSFQAFYSDVVAPHVGGLTREQIGEAVRNATSRFVGGGASGETGQTAPDGGGLDGLKTLVEQAAQTAPEMAKGLLALLQGYLDSIREVLKRRERGEYEVDEFGLDPEFAQMSRPFFRFLYKTYWRVTTTGIGNVPGKGRALLVANHAGVMPWDGAMINMAVWEEHPSPRYVRTLYLDWFQTLPYVSILLARTGQVMACPENGERLLKQDALTAVFPEGVKGVGKLFRDRYRLARFGRGGFVKMAIRCRAPIIPVSVVGSEEVHPSLARMTLLEKLTGIPIIPMTPTFPWTGLLGLIPLPSKWYLHFGEPVDCAPYPPEAAEDYLLVARLTAQVRDTIQEKIHELLKERKTVFW
ncbi:MAG: acyltransferase family protein [Planctomycetes bacterium]|nr:acyltransferase family protein [Planctomycetota bacterium]